MAEKYVVLKKEDWDLMRGQATPLNDCVVIRLHDVFATSALYTYANEITTSLEVMELAGVGADEEVVKRLEDLREFFAMMGDKSRDIEWKKVAD